MSECGDSANGDIWRTAWNISLIMLRALKKLFKMLFLCGLSLSFPYEGIKYGQRKQQLCALYISLLKKLEMK